MWGSSRIEKIGKQKLTKKNCILTSKKNSTKNVKKIKTKKTENQTQNDLQTLPYFVNIMRQLHKKLLLF